MESIFPGGSSSPEFEKFRKDLAADLEKATKEVEVLQQKGDKASTEEWIAMMVTLRKLSERINHGGSFTYCLTSQDVNDEKAMVMLEEFSSYEAASHAIQTSIEGFAKAVDDATWKKVVADDRLSGEAFFWNEFREQARLKMEPALEKLASDLAVNGLHAWERLYSKMAGDLRAEFTAEGKTESLSMGQIKNKLSDPDRSVRKQAFEKYFDAWKSIEALTTMQLNSLAGFRLSLYRARGWDDPLFEALMFGRVKKDTVEAMWNAVETHRDTVKKYIDAKQKYLGIDKFMWYDQLAPVARAEKRFSYQQASEFVVEHLTGFSKDMGEFARRAIDSRWIEAEDRTGKADGGYCTSLPLIKQSRIFMTFSGNYNEMMTLAHEIGHAYHSYVLKDRDYFARFYPMNLAETASTFNELLVTDAALNATDDKDMKLSLIDKKIEESFVMCCDIRSRFIFESKFYEERKKGSVPKDRMNELMVEAQKEAFGDILDEGGYHPLFWASKQHFSISDLAFYNFPYTFGHLFAGGIYDRAKKEGAAFADAYRGLLGDTGSMTCEEVAKKHMGVDITKQDFWNDAVARSLADVDEFVELTK
jgi:pepF/M3 family oligoendopeptidase